MLNLRPAAARGTSTTAWLTSHHSFSFGDYHDDAHMGYRDLRVINDDKIAAGAGFPMHSHRDMEIISFVHRGALAHRDSLGTSSTIVPGEIQAMSAGTGIRHSEFNPSQVEETRLIQIWLLPRARNLAPGYAQQKIDAAAVTGRFGLVAAGDPQPGAITINQDTRLYLAHLPQGASASFALPAGRHGWLQIVEGDVLTDEKNLTTGFGASWNQPAALDFLARQESTILLFDLA